MYAEKMTFWYEFNNEIGQINVAQNTLSENGLGKCHTLMKRYYIFKAILYYLKIFKSIILKQHHI